MSGSSSSWGGGSELKWYGIRALVPKKHYFFNKMATKKLRPTKNKTHPWKKQNTSVFHVFVPTLPGDSKKVTFLGWWKLTWPFQPFQGVNASDFQLGESFPQRHELNHLVDVGKYTILLCLWDEILPIYQADFRPGLTHLPLIPLQMARQGDHGAQMGCGAICGGNFWCVEIENQLYKAI